MDFDLILDYLGHLGRFQLFILLLCGLSQFYGGLQFSSSIFFYPNASSFACACNAPTLSYVPQVPVPSTSLELPLEKYGTIHADIHKQLTVDFDLVNDDEELNSTISNSVFGLGAMLGCIVAGICADKFGRKPVMKKLTVLMTISSISTSLALNFGIFCFLRFITAISMSGLFQTGYIMAVEYTGTKKRPLTVGFMQIVFIFGKLLLSFAAYYIGSWRALEFVISLPALFMIVYFWWLPESVRWLIHKGKYSRGMLIVLKAAKWNKVNLPPVLLKDLGYDEMEDTNYDYSYCQPHRRSGPCVMIWNSEEMRKWSLTMCFIWVVNSMVYYDISSNSGHLDQNIALNFAIVSASEIPAILFVVIVLYICERRHTTCFFMVLGAVLCVVTAIIPQGHPLLCGWIGLSGKSFISASNTMIYIYTVEIFPTNLRGTTTGLTAMFFHFGGILAPFIYKLRKVYCPFPSLIFAAVSVVAGCLALKLPERMDWQLPETVAECQAFGILRESGIARLYRPRSLTLTLSDLNVDDEETQLLKHL